jgi:hypothetical protein
MGHSAIFLPSTQMNVFKGGRRIAILFAAVWAIGVISVTWFMAPDPLWFIYETDGPQGDGSTQFWPRQQARLLLTGQQPDPCGPHDAIESGHYVTAAGHKANVQFCFLAMKAEDGRLLIPYGVDAERVWMAGRNTPLVTKYTTNAVQSWHLGEEDEEFVDILYGRQRSKRIKQGTLWLIGGWAVLWLVSAIVGWIVRGFLDIPSGKDTAAGKDADK